ncbi:unnamed protein product [Heterobilharzia americana]|nr:unnamed protein product [Heterobilharzia americana]
MNLNNHCHVSLLDLPDELILRILTYLRQIDLIRCVSRINKKFHVLTRSSYLWKNLDLCGYRVEPKDLRLFSRQKLVGRQTCSTKIECGGIQDFQNFIRLFSDYLEKLELIETVAKNRLINPQSSSSIPRFSLRYLNLTDSSWIHEAHLLALIGITPSENLKHLNVSKCYRLFLGPPASCPLDVRFEKMSTFFKQACPYLEKLNLSSIFISRTSQLHVPPGIQTKLLQIIPETLPYLHTLNLSGNTMITSFLLNLHQNGELSSVFQCFISAFFNKIHKYQLILYIYDWSHELTMSLFSACSLVVPNGSRVSLHVNNVPVYTEKSVKCEIIPHTIALVS